MPTPRPRPARPRPRRPRPPDRRAPAELPSPGQRAPDPSGEGGTASAAVAAGPPADLDARVDLAGHVLPLAELRAHPERYRRWFAAAAAAPGYAVCLCTRPGQRLVIRELAAEYHLARWPDSAGDHAGSCFFRSTPSNTGAPTRRDPFSVTATGTRVTVDTPLSPAPGALAPGTLTLDELLQRLWKAADLTVDAPPRRWEDCATALTSLVAGLRLGPDPAPNWLHVIAAYRQPSRATDDDGADRAHAAARESRLATFLRPLEHPTTATIRGGPLRGRTRHLLHRRLLLGELRDLTPAPHGHMLALRHFARPVHLTRDLHTRLTHTSPAAFSEPHARAARRVVLALVEGAPSGRLRLVDATGLLTSMSYIPLARPDAITPRPRHPGPRPRPRP